MVNRLNIIIYIKQSQDVYISV